MACNWCHEAEEEFKTRSSSSKHLLLFLLGSRWSISMPNSSPSVNGVLRWCARCSPHVSRSPAGNSPPLWRGVARCWGRLLVTRSIWYVGDNLCLGSNSTKCALNCIDWCPIELATDICSLCFLARTSAFHIIQNKLRCSIVHTPLQPLPSSQSQHRKLGAEEMKGISLAFPFAPLTTFLRGEIWVCLDVLT